MKKPKMSAFWNFVGIFLLWSISEFGASATRVTRGHFKGAVYEHHVLLYPDLSRPPSRQQALTHMYRNLAILGNQAEESNRQGVDILVFPEYGIYGIGKFSRDSMKPFLENIPNPKEGITYVSVHDCFWTHGCDVEVMNRICREQFVSLHKQPILQDLSVHLLNKFGSKRNAINLNGRMIDKEALVFLDEVLSRVPTKGTFDLNAVLESTYFFS